MRCSHGAGVVDGGTRGGSVGLWCTGAKFILVIGIVVLVNNSASETESVDGGGVLLGESDADDLDRGSMTEESLGTASVSWNTSDGGKDVTDISSQPSMMIGRCAVGSMGGAISGGGSSVMELSSVGKM